MILAPSRNLYHPGLGWKRNRPAGGTSINLANPLAHGLVFVSAFTDGAGLRLRDYSPQGNHGVLSAAMPWSATGLTFVPTKHVDLGNPPSLDITEAFSVEIRTRTTVEDNRLVTKDTALAGTRGWYFLIRPAVSSGTRFLVSSNGTALTYRDSPETVHDGKLHQIVGVYDTQNLLIYVDGRDVSGALTGAVPPSINVSTAPTYIGRHSTKYFTGTNELVRIWRGRGLNAGEIWRLHRRPYEMFEAYR